MTTARKIVAIGVVAALGVLAWTTLRNPDPASGPAGTVRMPDAGTMDAPSATAPDTSPVGTTGSDGTSPPGTAPRDRTVPETGDSSASVDMPRYLHELDPQQITGKFAVMLDPGDCGMVQQAQTPAVPCNAAGVLNQRLQQQLQRPDPQWTPLAQRELESAVEAAAMRLQGRIRIVDVRCGVDVCQVLAIAPAADHRPPGGWDDQVRGFPQSRWWRELGMADMSQLMSSGPDGNTVYYVTQLSAAPRR